MQNQEEQNKQVALFKGKNIRRIIHNKEWYFSVVDVVGALTDSPAPRQYWGVLKSRETQLLTVCLQLKLEASDGKKYETDCADTAQKIRKACLC